MSQKAPPNYELFVRASRNAPTILESSLQLANEGGVFDNLAARGLRLDNRAKDLQRINDHITVAPELIQTAVNHYEQVAKDLIGALGWPDEAIRVFPQGSAATKTLIRSADASDFDIDAVCQVDASYVDMMDPIGFFQKIGDALTDYKPEPKNRCWKINSPGDRHYLEFTPSVPFRDVPVTALENLGHSFSIPSEYESTALSVADNKLKAWKPSNPKGFAQWVNDTAEYVLLTSVLDSVNLSASTERVEPVREQSVPLEDTLRVAIRLLKRHRDIKVRRKLIKPEHKPISVIIVTLVTGAYEYLAQNNRVFDHPITLLSTLASLMVNAVQVDAAGHYWIENPTVRGENFAERWHEDSDARAKAFKAWGESLVSDLAAIVSTMDSSKLGELMDEAFGQCTDADGGQDKSLSGLIFMHENEPVPSPPPKADGLA